VIVESGKVYRFGLFVGLSVRLMGEILLVRLKGEVSSKNFIMRGRFARDER
jgi:hypothetical protein